MPCITLIIRRYPDVEKRKRNERAWRGCDAVGCHSSEVSFYYSWYGAIINDSIPKSTNIEQMYVYASERSERA